MLAVVLSGKEVNSSVIPGLISNERKSKDLIKRRKVSVIKKLI